MADSGTLNPAVAGLKGLLDKQTALREVAEERARRARDALQRVAEALCSQELDRVRKEDASSLSVWDADRIADLIIREVRQQLDQIDLAGVLGQDVATQRQQASADARALRDELSRTQRQLEEAERTHLLTDSRAEAAEKQIEVLEQTVADLQRRLATAVAVPTQTPETLAQPSTPTSDLIDASTPPPLHRLHTGPEPEWMGKWRQAETFQRDAALVMAMGETGECRRNRLADLVGDRLGLRPRGGGVKRIFPRLVNIGLVETVPFQQVIRGRSTHLLKLTPQGQKAYLFLTRTEPVPSLLDEMLMRHKSPEHAYLNMEAADLLEEAGYTVDRYPPEISLSERGKFVPDLGATSSADEVLWIEVERDTRKSPQARKTKWTNYYEATGGHFVIVTADRSAMDKISSEIAFWADARPLRIWMTNITEAKAGDRGRDGSIWLYQRGTNILATD
jgi:hypothetical protein